MIHPHFVTPIASMNKVHFSHRGMTGSTLITNFPFFWTARANALRRRCTVTPRPLMTSGTLTTTRVWPGGWSQISAAGRHSRCTVTIDERRTAKHRANGAGRSMIMAHHGRPDGRTSLACRATRNCPPQHSSRLYSACLHLNPIAVGNQIVGSLLDLIRRQLRFASRGGHIVHRWKGAVGSTAG